MINTIVTLSRDEEDYATENFFRTFVDEQVEEEALFGGIVDKLKKAGESGLFVLDIDLGQRKDQD
jgi:ferritin